MSTSWRAEHDRVTDHRLRAGDRRGAGATNAEGASPPRTVLEVIDRRRTPAQLRTLLAPGLIDSVTAFAHETPVHSGAVLRRVRLQPGDAAESAFEVAATYGRGARTHALAGRIEQVATGRGTTAWQFVALHIG